ncbi:MAG TPA: Flp pilus assembly protein CpaB [Terriglobales bacterium]|jgi:pilus assembly protein CpaB|nr:Flp pilus assembly protein CpaB [Terriglobales bacterium]
MNRNRLILIGFVALALGALVSMSVYRNLQSRTATDNRPGVDVVIATGNLQVGAKIADKDVKVVRMPAGDLPPHIYQKAESVIGRGVVLPISQGEFILPSKLAAENAGAGLPALIPPGMRAVSVRVNDTTAVAGFVLPGTRVDVLLTGNPGGSAEQQTTTVLENVAVIATGQKLERNSTGDPQMAPVITLLVSPDDAQRLVMASTQGHIQLALRNPLDTRQEELAAVRSGALYKTVSAPPAPTAPHVKPKHNAVAPPPAPAVYEIEVIRGDKKDVTKF